MLPWTYYGTFTTIDLGVAEITVKAVASVHWRDGVIFDAIGKPFPEIVTLFPLSEPEVPLDA